MAEGDDPIAELVLFWNKIQTIMHSIAPPREATDKQARLRIFAESGMTWGSICLLVGSVQSPVAKYFIPIAGAVMVLSVWKVNFFEGPNKRWELAGNCMIAIVLTLAFIGIWKVIPKPPEALTKADLHDFGEQLSKNENRQQPTQSMPIASSSQAATVSDLASLVKQVHQTPFLNGMSDQYLADMARSLAGKIIFAWNEWFMADGSILDRYRLLLTPPISDTEKERLTGERAQKRAIARGAYESTTMRVIRDGNIARKAILQRLNSYPPTSAEDKFEEGQFEGVTVSNIDKFVGKQNGEYLSRLGDRLVPR